MASVGFGDLEKRMRRGLKHTARFWPVDLHCHTPLSRHCFGRKDGHSQTDVTATPQQIAEAACQSGLYILAVTDHHRCENAQEVAAAAAEIREAGEDLYPNNNLVVLPGMEIAVEENGRTVHVLALFPEGTSATEIDRILDKTGIEPNPDDRTAASQVTRKRLSEFVGDIRDRGGLAILAHVNSDNGYRHEMRELGWTEEQILQAITGLDLDAIEVSRPDDVEHFQWHGQQLPCVLGSDAHYVKDIGQEACISRIKMASPSFAQLTRAFQDPTTRLRFDEPTRQNVKHIVGVSLQGGFLDDQSVPFTSNLNCLIGGRGTGKSTLIEAIRYVFQHSLPADRRSEIQEMRQEVFGGCTATLIFEGQRREKCVLRRTYGDTETEVMMLDGRPVSEFDLSSSHNVRVSVYGWSEIEKIAKDPSQQLDLIDSFIPEVQELERDEKNALLGLTANARQVQTTLEALDIDEVGNLTELRDELASLGEEETKEEKDQAKARNEASVVTDVEASLAKLREEVEAIDVQTAVESAAAAIESAKDDGRLLSTEVFDAILALLREAIADNGNLQGARHQLLDALDDLTAQVREKAQELEPLHQEIAQRFQKLLDEIKDPETRDVTTRRQHLLSDINEREAALTARRQTEETLQDLRADRWGILAELERARQALYAARDRHVGRIAAQLPKGKTDVDISIEIRKQEDRTAFCEMLETALKGIPRKWREGRFPSRIADHFHPTEFASVVRDKDYHRLQDARFTEDVAKDIIRHLEDSESTIMAFEACPCSDLPVILFDVEGEKKPIGKLSPGQRCTALLPIILLETDTPLVIDQPEDNLDNQFIFDLVVDTMRRLKERRQIIVATHNPNIPVSGDAENILVFQTRGERGELARNGSIDYAPIIEDVKNIMEGGEEAFQVRKRKYGL